MLPIWSYPLRGNSGSLDPPSVVPLSYPAISSESKVPIPCTNHACHVRAGNWERRAHAVDLEMGAAALLLASRSEHLMGCDVDKFVAHIPHESRRDVTDIEGVALIVDAVIEHNRPHVIGRPNRVLRRGIKNRIVRGMVRRRARRAAAFAWLL